MITTLSIVTLARLKVTISKLVFGLLIAAASLKSQAIARVYSFRDDNVLRSVFLHTKYDQAILELDDGIGFVSGHLTLLDDLRPRQIHGYVSDDGSMTLFINDEFHFYSKGKYFDLDIWSNKTKTADVEMSFPEDINHFFYSASAGTLSQASLLLAYPGCGTPYGIIEVRLKPGATQAEFTKEMAEHHEVAGLPAIWGAGDDWQGKLTGGLRGTLKDVMISILLAKRASPPLFNIPIGSELSVVTALRSMSVVEYADLGGGECAGPDRQFFVTYKDRLFDNGEFSQSAALSYLSNGIAHFLSRYADEGGRSFKILPPSITKVNVPPFPSAITFPVIARSEITRDFGREWDLFNVVFEPFDTQLVNSNEYGVVVYIEGLTSTKRSLGRDTIPNPTEFNRHEVRIRDEAALALSIEEFFATQPGGVRCIEPSVSEPNRAGDRSSTTEEKALSSDRGICSEN